MYEPQQQHLLDLHDNTVFGSEPKSWLSGDDLRSTLSSLSAAAANASATGNVDRVLFNDLVEMVPLVQSLIDRKTNTSFTRRGSMIYTKTPSRESLFKKTAGRAPSLPGKKNKEPGDKDQNKNAANNQDGCADEFSIFSSKPFISDKDREELMTLRDQVEDLKRQLSEKDELLRSAELSKNELSSVRLELGDLRNEAAEKESLIKSMQLQLSDGKVKLADKQAAVEKLQWETMTSNKQVERLQETLEMMQGEISSFMLLIQGLTSNEHAPFDGDYDILPDPLYQNHELDYLNEAEMQKLEAARVAYVVALMAAKEKQDEESIAAAATARVHLQAIVLNQA